MNGSDDIQHREIFCRDRRQFPATNLAVARRYTKDTPSDPHCAQVRALVFPDNLVYYEILLHVLPSSLTKSRA